MDVTKPPLDVEQAIDLILATPAMFSRKNEGQRDFGKLIVEEYYSKLRTENKDDPVAYRYLVNLFAAISSAVRAFGVQRAIFGTIWETIENVKQHEIEAAERLTNYSPLRGEVLWNRVQGLMMSFLGGGGLGGSAGLLIRIRDNQALLIVALTLVGWAAAIVGLDYWLQKRKDSRIAEIMKKYPGDVTDRWKNEIIPQYRKIMTTFMYSAIKIREEFYPDLPTLDDSKIFDSNAIPHIQFKRRGGKQAAGLSEQQLEKKISEIIDRHFSF